MSSSASHTCGGRVQVKISADSQLALCSRYSRLSGYHGYHEDRHESQDDPDFRDGLVADIVLSICGAIRCCLTASTNPPLTQATQI